jgi:hypothetical protein
MSGRAADEEAAAAGAAFEVSAEHPAAVPVFF